MEGTTFLSGSEGRGVERVENAFVVKLAEFLVDGVNGRLPVYFDAGPGRNLNEDVCINFAMGGVLEELSRGSITFTTGRSIH
jgi:hypothetical protein